MTKSELDRAVARATGESLATIRSLGFSVVAVPAEEPQVVDWDELPVRVVQRQFSPLLPHNYRESSYPVGIFETVVENRSASPLSVGLMFSWQNVLGRSRGMDTRGGQRHEAGSTVPRRRGG